VAIPSTNKGNPATAPKTVVLMLLKNLFISLNF